MTTDLSQFEQVDIIEIKQCLIIPIQIDLYDEFIANLRKKILDRVNNAVIHGVVLDISAIKIIDSINLTSIINLCKMIDLMGKKAVVIGFQPNVAAALTEFPDLELKKIVTFINLETAINYLINLKIK